MSVLKRDFVAYYGDEHDGVIEVPASTKDGGVLEIGYYFGDAKPKNIIGISSQIGCPARCKFCELGNEKFDRNLSLEEMVEEVRLMHETVKRLGLDDEKKIKITVAKAGEPMFNRNVVGCFERLSVGNYSFKMSSVFPDTGKCMDNFYRLAEFASMYENSVQFQISLVSTSEEYRKNQIGINVLSFKDIRNVGEYWRNSVPDGRKVNLSLILTDDVPVDVSDARDILPTELFRFRFRNYVPTQYGIDNGLEVIGKGKFDLIYTSFEDNGYDVSEWGTPTKTEQRFGLASNVTRRRYQQMVDGKF